TFHTGGVAGEDITHGLPRVQELFEARRPKGEAQITELSGVAQLEEDMEKKVRRITVTSDDGDQVQYAVSMRARLAVSDGDRVEVGQQLTEGSVNPHEKLRVEGVQALQMFQVDEVQQVYRSQGVTIHDKHIEIIVRRGTRSYCRASWSTASASWRPIPRSSSRVARPRRPGRSSWASRRPLSRPTRGLRPRPSRRPPGS
ncbi:MAG: hypothetical protein E6G47_06125, partial [Actinobacteria bacterium]